MGLKKITLKCGNKEVKILKSVGDSLGLSDNQKVDQNTLQRAVTVNSDYVLRVMKSVNPRV